MAVAVIGGLLTSMFLTLVVVPALYSIIDTAAEKVFRKQKSSVPSPQIQIET